MYLVPKIQESTHHRLSAVKNMEFPQRGQVRPVSFSDVPTCEATIVSDSSRQAR